MKKIIALTLALAFVLSAAGCGNSNGDEVLERPQSSSAIETTEIVTEKTTTTVKTTKAEETHFYYDSSFEDLTFSIRDDYNIASEGVWVKESGNGFSFVSMPDAFSGNDVLSAKSALAVYASVDDMEIKEWTEVDGQQAVISVSVDSTNLLFFVGTKMYMLICQNMEDEEIYRLISSIKINESSALVKEQTTEPTEDNVSLGMKNALESAKSYISYSSFSYTGLIEQLEYEKYSHEEAVYGADNCGADWNEQAKLSAKSYIDYSDFSYDGLIEQLEYEGFTNEEAIYGADNCGADWFAEAAECAQSYIDYSSFSRQELYDQLIYEKFTAEQAEYGVSAVGY